MQMQRAENLHRDRMLQCNPDSHHTGARGLTILSLPIPFVSVCTLLGPASSNAYHIGTCNWTVTMMLSNERMRTSLSSSAATQMASGPLFTSTSVPSTPGLAGSCQLPLGCVVSAFSKSGAGNGQKNALLSADAHHIEDDKVAMNICLSCLAHINPYCQYETSNGQWTCSVCGYEDNIISDPAIFADNSANSPLISNVVEYVQRAADADGGAGGCAYVFVVDGHLPSAEVRSVLHTIRSIFEGEKSLIGSRNAAIGLIIFGKTVSIYQLGLRAGLASADVYPASSSLLDGTSSDASISEERAYLAGVDSGLDALERCLDAHFDLASDETATGTAPSGSGGGMGATTSRREMLRQRREERLRREVRSADIGGRGGSSKATVETDTGKRSSRISARQMRRKRRTEREKRRCTGAAINMAINLISASSEEHELETNRILLFTNGCCNHGPGSVVAPIVASSTDENQRTANQSRAAALPASPSRKGSPRRQRRSAGDIIDPVAMAEASEFFQLLGKDAFETNVIGIDCFIGGSTNVGMPVYLALSGPSDGYCMTYETFSSEEAAADLRHVLERTHVSKAGSIHRRDSIPYANGEDGARLNKLTGCILDIRCSPFISPHSVVGPGSVEYDDERTVIANEQGSYAHGAQRAAAIGLPTSGLPSKDMISGTLTRLRLGRFDALATHTLVMQINDDIQPEDEHAVFQFVARFATPDGNHIVTRIFNHRLPVRDTHAFVEGLQGVIVSIVLGREAVYRATSGRGSTGEEEVAVIDRDRDDELTNDARKDIDATIHLASATYRLLGLRAGKTSDMSSSASSLDFAFPPELADGLRALYSLRRGPLLGTGPQQSPDDRCISRSLFMRLPLSDCLPIMSPSVWCCGANTNSTARGFSLEPVPAVTLALWDESVLAVDQFDNLFVWSGSKTLGSAYDPMRQACKDHLLRVSYGRFPKPHLQMLKEGDSMSRRLTSRLAPAHGDPPEHQVAYFPALSHLSTQQLAALRAKFTFYDPNADPSFRRWFWQVASASSNASKEGVALCANE